MYLPCNSNIQLINVNDMDEQYLCQPVRRCKSVTVKPMCKPETVICREVVSAPCVRRAVTPCYKPLLVKRNCAAVRSSYYEERAYNACKPCEKLLNDKGQFFVFIDNKHPHLQMLINKAQQLGLTVSGDGTNVVKGGDITHAEEGNYISFGSSSRFDMNWIRYADYMEEKGFKPVYDIVSDWSKILRALNEFAKNKKNSVRYTKGLKKSTFHAGFAVVDGKVKKYGKDQVAVKMPVENFRTILDSYTHRNAITILY